MLFRGDNLSLFGAFFSAYRSSEGPLLSLSSTIFLLARSRSFIVLISLSTLPLPLWSVIGHFVFYAVFFFMQKFLNLLLVNAVPGSVRICRGMPLSAIYLVRNSSILSVIGALKNFASGHPDLLSTETIRYFLELRAILNGLSTETIRYFLELRAIFKRFVFVLG